MPKSKFNAKSLSWAKKISPKRLILVQSCHTQRDVNNRTLKIFLLLTPPFRFEARQLELKNLPASVKMSIGNALKQGIFVVGAKRTPFGSFGGALKSHTPTDLQVGAL